MELTAYKPVENVAQDLSKLDASLSYLNKRHEENLAEFNKLSVEIANAEMDDSESQYKQDYYKNAIAEINNIVDQNAGNFSATLNEISTASRNVATDQEFIGKIKTNKERKEFIKSVDDSKTIPDDMKEYFKSNEFAKYEYNPITDENGKIIGTKEWKPKEDVLDQPDLNTLYNKAVAALNADGKSTDGILTIKDNTTGATINIDASKFDPATQTIIAESKYSKEYLSKPKVKNAIKSALEAEPGAISALHQRYEAQLWRANNNKSSEIRSFDGGIIKEKDWLNNLLDGRVKGTVYNRSVSDVDIKYREPTNVKSSKEPDINIPFESNTIGGTIENTGERLSNMIDTYNSSMDNLANICKNYGIGADVIYNENGTYKDPIGMANALTYHIGVDENLSFEKKKEAIDAVRNSYRIAQLNKDKLQYYTKNISDEDIDALGYATGLNITADNKYQKELNTTIDDLFRDKDSTDGAVDGNINLAYISNFGTISNDVKSELDRYDIEYNIIKSGKGKEILIINQSDVRENPNIISNLFTNDNSKNKGNLVRCKTNNNGNLIFETNYTYGDENLYVYTNDINKAGKVVKVNSIYDAIHDVGSNNVLSISNGNNYELNKLTQISNIRKNAIIKSKDITKKIDENKNKAVTNSNIKVYDIPLTYTDENGIIKPTEYYTNSKEILKNTTKNELDIYMLDENGRFIKQGNDFNYEDKIAAVIGEDDKGGTGITMAFGTNPVTKQVGYQIVIPTKSTKQGVTTTKSVKYFISPKASNTVNSKFQTVFNKIPQLNQALYLDNIESDPIINAGVMQGDDFSITTKGQFGFNLYASKSPTNEFGYKLKYAGKDPIYITRKEAINLMSSDDKLSDIITKIGKTIKESTNIDNVSKHYLLGDLSLIKAAYDVSGKLTKVQSDFLRSDFSDGYDFPHDKDFKFFEGEGDKRKLFDYLEAGYNLKFGLIN